MLDLSIDIKTLEQDFDRIAKDLLQGYVLRIGTQRYQLMEIEFYYNNKAGTLDNFAHEHDSPNGTWRLHGAGLDLVLSKKGEYHGGILLRGLQPLGVDGQAEGGYIDGPWNSARRCIASKGRVDQVVAFYLEPRVKKIELVFKKSPRVGLFLRKVEDLKYICKPWRYNSIPTPSQRYRQLMFLSAYVKGEAGSIELGLSTRSKNNYIQYFEEGRQMAAADFVKGKTGVQQTCRLFGYCYQHDLTT
ncbi:MAG: hypothetical protein ACRBFS_12780 [Aureispira sp.]